MTLTPAGRVVLVLAALALILFLVGVAGRVASGQWDAGAVAVVITVPMVALLALMSWRWEA